MGRGIRPAPWVTANVFIKKALGCMGVVPIETVCVTLSSLS
jgi:hypothetical protein